MYLPKLIKIFSDYERSFTTAVFVYTLQLFSLNSELDETLDRNATRIIVY